MRTVYVRERSFHTPVSLARTLGIEVDDTDRYIAQLCAHGVLRLRTGDEPKEYDPLGEGAPRGTYQFVYVGLALVEGICIVVYPKYLPVVDPLCPEDATRASMRQVFGVLRKSGGSYASIAAATEDGMRANDRLALMLSLLEMYDEYGVYSNYVHAIADNGSGNISWERTIAANLPFVRDGRPIYFDYKTVETDADASDFVTRLHRAVLTECSHFMQESGLAQLLALDEVWLSDSSVADFGDADFVAYRLECERAVQFVTWKQDVIDLLVRYVRDEGVSATSDAPLCLGTSSFHHLWETACKVAFGDVLSVRLDELGIELAPPFTGMAKMRLIDVIPRPEWAAMGADEERACGEVATLIPDIVTVRGAGGCSAGGGTFAILDAKYYTPLLDERVGGVPGVESVTKQFLYQAAYRDFVLAHGFSRVVNAFLVPSCGDAVEHLGRVRFPGVIAAEEPPFSNEVELYALPAEAVFDAYVGGRELDAARLAEVIG
ncbi:LlaJI family restriction endonuclease [Thermophilibacter provencensis]|uniref:LlaJI family restriction endonuclease n=1 Tax=Thermophilibacter provencensis TaxID=1852386 RepID=UPI00235741E5|nr:LlaJI family restriction endonuclease [Thermophilibacter provencensis]